MAVLAFCALLLAALGGLYLFHIEGDFYSAFRGALDRGFYVSAGVLLMFSTVLFTPFSYGISRYFLCAARGEARLRTLFFMFRSPALLSKATAVALMKKGLIYLERLGLLLGAALVEVALFFSFLLVHGIDLFTVHENPFRAAAGFMMHTPWLIGLSVALWSMVLLGVGWINLRFILCKYVLLCRPDVSAWQALRVGRLAIRGKMFQTLFFYLRCAAFCVLTVMTFGLASHRAEPHAHSFSVYAAALAEEGWRQYCRRRSLRAN